MRSFISVDLPNGINEEIEEIQGTLKETNADIKYVSPEKVHYTVKFLGDIEKREVDDIMSALKESVKGPSSFRASVEGVGVFPNLGYMKVVWLGMSKGKDRFKELFQNVEDEITCLGFDSEEHEFVPHATIGRVKSGKNKNRLKKTIGELEDIRVGEFEVDRVRLKKSELKSGGPVYSTIDEVELCD